MTFTTFPALAAPARPARKRPLRGCDAGRNQPVRRNGLIRLQTTDLIAQPFVRVVPLKGGRADALKSAGT